MRTIDIVRLGSFEISTVGKAKLFQVNNFQAAIIMFFADSKEAVLF